ncbi:MAG: RluA family pseudouridine synthase [Pseudomonadota bacterium]
MDVYTPPAPVRPLLPIYRDEDCMIFEKPSGLLSVPGRGPDKQDCMSSRVAEEHIRVLIVHRLDMETSGLLLFARFGDAQRAFSELFATAQVDKTYTAIVAGSPDADEGEIDLPLMRDWPNRPKQKVDYEEGKPARTLWKVLERVDGKTRLELKPITGRTHQLRVHLDAIGHPILGDNLYGTVASRSAADRLMLHATRLKLRNPFTGHLIDVTSRPPF